jgi:hypothetical protein
MSRKSFRATRAAVVLALLAGLRLLLPLPVAADSLHSSPRPLDSLADLMGVVQDLWNGLMNRLGGTAPQPASPTPGKGGVDVDSWNPVDDGGDRGGTIDPNGGGTGVSES